MGLSTKAPPQAQSFNLFGNLNVSSPQPPVNPLFAGLSQPKQEKSQNPGIDFFAQLGLQPKGPVNPYGSGGV